MGIDRVKEQQTWSGLHPKVKRGAYGIMNDVTFSGGRATHNRTGADVTHVVDVGLRTTHKQIRGLKAADEMSEHVIDNGGFILAFFKELRMFEARFPKLTKQDTARLMYIGTFIAWETNRLQSDNGKKHYTKNDLEELVEMSRKRFNEFFKRLEKADIIHEKATGELFLNPTVFYRGDLKNHEYDIKDFKYTRLFKKTVRELYSQFKGRKLAQLANIYSVLPFISFGTNIVCYNPEETSEDLIRPMPLNKLAVLLGYEDNHKLKRALETIKVDNNPVFWVAPNVHDKRAFRIIVNPRVVFAGDGESLRAVKAMFN